MVHCKGSLLRNRLSLRAAYVERKRTALPLLGYLKTDGLNTQCVGRAIFPVADWTLYILIAYRPQFPLLPIKAPNVIT